MDNEMCANCGINKAMHIAEIQPKANIQLGKRHDVCDPCLDVVRNRMSGDNNKQFVVKGRK